MATRIGHTTTNFHAGNSPSSDLEIGLFIFESNNEQDEFDIYSANCFKFISIFFRKTIARFSVIDGKARVFIRVRSGNYSGPRVSWQLMICN